MLLRLLIYMSLVCLTACATPPATAPMPDADSDGDGVIDPLDRCPQTDLGVVVDVDGCPPDSDQDGVVDGRDLCPSTEPGVAVDSSGCPLDDDGDGIANDRDQCPGTPAGTLVDAQGCPKVVEPPPPRTLELKIGFHSGSAELDDDYAAEFVRGAEFIRSHPSCSAVIEGHTDSVGPADFNRKLSLRRAEVAMDKMNAVLGPDSLAPSVVGYGEERPVAENDSQQGRQKNRRVVIAITCNSAAQR